IRSNETGMNSKHSEHHHEHGSGHATHDHRSDHAEHAHPIDHHEPHAYGLATATEHNNHADYEGHHAHQGHNGHDAHAGHGGHGGHGDHVGQFRRLFWIMLLLAVPVVGFNEMFAHLIGYHLPDAEWVWWVSPALG